MGRSLRGIGRGGPGYLTRRARGGGFRGAPGTEMEMALPVLTDEQRAENLRKALEVRRTHAKIKAKLKRGEIDQLDAFGLEELQGVKLAYFLRCLPGIGYVRAYALLREWDISQSRTIGGLGKHQRERVAEWLRARR